MSNKAIIQKQKDSRLNYTDKAVDRSNSHRVLFMQKVMNLNDCIEYLQNQRKKKLNNG
jgi:glycerol-3-phosphate responsive antiterminator